MLPTATDIDILPELTTASPSSLTEKAQAAADIPSKSSGLTEDLLPPLDERPRFSDLLFRRGKTRARNPSDTATRRSVFDDPELAKYYWPTAKYENLHRFDPDARWTFAEEAAVVRKIDRRVLIWAAISFATIVINANGLKLSLSDNFLHDLRLTTDDYNLGITVLRVTFLSAQLPSQLVGKRLGPDWWVPTKLCAWAIVSLSQFWLSGKPSFIACCALIGFFQGGFLEDLILYLSYFYTSTELPIRLGLFWLASDFSAICGHLLGVGLLRMRGVSGKAGWRWLFLIEGMLFLAIGITTLFIMPPSLTQTKTWYRPDGWFTEREEIISVSRVLRDDPTKGDMHNRKGLSLRRIWRAVCDYDLWPLYIMALTLQIPTTTPAIYLSLSLRNLGFDTLATGLLTIPSAFLAVVTMFSAVLLSEAVNDRSLMMVIESVWALPCLLAFNLLPAKPHPWSYYGVAVALLASPSTFPIRMAWCSHNSGAVASRTVNATLFAMFMQTGVIVSANIYRADDAPRYKRGNHTLVAICVFNIVLSVATKMYYVWRNKRRARVWDSMSSEERAVYLETTTDVGNRRLDFRFVH